jgi:hypothetical protein
MLTKLRNRMVIPMVILTISAVAGVTIFAINQNSPQPHYYDIDGHSHADSISAQDGIHLDNMRKSGLPIPTFVFPWSNEQSSNSIVPKR